MTCPKCKKEMEKGTLKGGSDFELEFGTQTNLLNQYKDGKPVNAYHCKDCGFIEMYTK